MIVERQLSEREIKALNKNIKDIARRKSRLTRFIILWTIACLVTGTVASMYVDRALWLVVVIAVFIFIAIGLWSYFESRLPFDKELKGIESLKEKNLVTSVQVKATEYYELAEEEDEGVYYLFQIEADRILSFGGQDFYPTKKFPNSDFEIVEGRSVAGQIVLLETYCHGHRIKPIKKIKGKDKWDLLQKFDLDKFEITDGRLERLA
ncbi:hypothetical protein [Chryseolinea soli]|uniref:Uncharacterized protein n=1 Tax=Chryseolinea soli TaxID=2321403 RepID=A0A385SMU8_9BACT|nr:hypothetical protein [Chryseolinea soli]AYB30318.1 hypothetical protein D4L85_06810 [Chryseolinea soli]